MKLQFRNAHFTHIIPSKFEKIHFYSLCFIGILVSFRPMLSVFCPNFSIKTVLNIRFLAIFKCLVPIKSCSIIYNLSFIFTQMKSSRLSRLRILNLYLDESYLQIICNLPNTAIMYVRRVKLKMNAGHQ